MASSTPKRSITTDDAIIVNMQITGNGDNKAVMAPEWPSSDSLEVYDPNVIEDQTFNNSGQITHRKTFEYLLVPKVVGKYSLKPKFTYFDTESNDYVTLTKYLPAINVIKGKNVAPIVRQEEAVELAPIYATTSLKKKGDKKYSAYLPFFLLGTIIIGGLGIFLYGRKLEKSGVRDPQLIRRQEASSVAQQRLETAQSHKSNNDSKAFHEEIVVALKKYFTDKYDIQALHIKKNELLAALKQKEISESILVDIKEIIDQSELAIYAPGSSTQMEGIYNKAVNVISQLES